MSALSCVNEKLRPMRHEQQVSYLAIMAAIDEGEKRICVQGPCGFGKTLLAAHIIAYYISLGLRVGFVAPRLSLIDQCVAEFGREGFAEHIGVIQGQHPLTDYHKLLQIASRDTLTRRKLPEIKVLIVDECHMMTKKLAKLIASMPDVIIIGLSATPWTQGLGKIFTKLIVAETTQGLIEKGLLAPFVVYAPSPEPNLEHVKTNSGDYNQGQLSDACNKPKLVADIVTTWFRLGENRPTICFAVDRAHARHICQRFVEAGVKAEYVDCYTHDLERREILERYRNGETKILVNVNVLAVGVDAPHTSCLIDAHPTRSEMLFVQTIGRALRISKGKTNAIILDHSGNTLRLGLVTDIVKNELCDGSEASRAKAKRRDKSEPLPKLCDDCKHAMAPHHEHCPQCGALQIKVTTVVSADGELIEFGSQQQSKFKHSIEAQANFYAGLKYICAQRNNNPGWASHKYRERFGAWPNNPIVRNVPAAAPSIEVVNFVRARDIAFQKGRRHG